MLTLITEAKAKSAIQRRFSKNLKKAITCRGVKNIGYPGGNVDEPLYSAGEDSLWCAFVEPGSHSKIPRYWNSFGIFSSAKSSQTIVVEVNIPSPSDSARVAGFFAEDSLTGETFVLHDGGIGGGRLGIGKEAFLAWSSFGLVEVDKGDGSARSGILVANVDTPDLADRIWKFVRAVDRFKKAVAAGTLDATDLNRQIKERDRYRPEFSGKKKGTRKRHLEYITYHGDIVQKIKEERAARAAPGEEVFNSILIDLYVKKRGALTEVYEIKSNASRQTLYTAIGQLLTHSVSAPGAVARYLAIPAEEALPGGFTGVFRDLGIAILRFSLERRGASRIVKLKS